MLSVIRTLLLAATVLVMPVAAWSASFCATNSSELQTALETAETNGQDDSIKIAAGTYNVPAGGFVYDPLNEPGGDNFDIEISGGWEEFAGNPCGANLGFNGPQFTVLSGTNSERVLDMAVDANSNVDISLLTFSQGFASGMESGGGLRLLTSLNYAGTITLETNIFLVNEAHQGGGLSLNVAAGSTANVRVLNSSLIGNTGRVNAGAAQLIVSTPEFVTRGLQQLPAVSFTNNTVVNNSDDNLAIGEANPGGVEVIGNVPYKFFINNNLWNNQGQDIHIEGGTGFRLYNNNFNSLSTFGDSPEFSENNISVEPDYVFCGIPCFEYTPVADSPLVDAGTQPALITLPWFIPALDVRQGTNDRINGDQVDIGAYENQSRLFSDRFEG